jgi:hypothetical protein
MIPPVGYALTAADYDECCPYEALTSAPTPGTANVQEYMAPQVYEVVSYETNTLEVVFSEPITVSSLEHRANYEVGGRNPDVAVASLSLEKVLLKFKGIEAGPDSIRVSGLQSLPGLEMPDGYHTFTASTTACSTLCKVQEYDSDGFSPLVDSTVCVVGFITVPPGIFQPDYASMYVQGLDGCGVNVFYYDPPTPLPRLGDFVYATGGITEYVSSAGAGATTEIFMSAASSMRVLSTGYPEPAPLILSTAGVSREDHEGKLLQSEGAVISTSQYDFYIDDGSGGVQVYQNFTDIDFTKYAEGMYVRVKGVSLQYDYTRPYLEGFELVPRYESDIEIIEGAFPAKAQLEVDARVFCPSCGEDGFDVTFGGPGTSEVILRLYDGSGRKVTTLYSGTSVGTVTVSWNGKDSDGRPVSPGLYVCHLEVTESVSGRRSTESVPIVVGVKLK